MLVNGERREAENMEYNTGAYDNGECGGGTLTEWLHCNGVIGFGHTTDNFGTNTLVIRARGTQGGEHIDLLINSMTIGQGWWLSTAYNEFTATVEGDGDINIEFDNDGTGKDVQLDWVKVNIQEPRQAENMEYNTAAYANNECGGGSYTEWMHCNGVIGFGNISDNFDNGTLIPCNINVPRTSALPNINTSYSSMYVSGNGPDLSNVNRFTINWSSEHNGLWDISMTTSNGIPNWYINLMDKVTQTFNQSNPYITLIGTGIAGLDGNYWAEIDGTNFVMVSKTGSYTIYCSNSSTMPCDGFKSPRPNVEQEINTMTRVYPNPAKDKLHLEIYEEGSKIIRAEIYNMTGEMVKNLNIESTKSIIDVSELQEGLYLLKTSFYGNVHIYRFMKK